MSNQPRPDEPHLIWSVAGASWWGAVSLVSAADDAQRYRESRALEITAGSPHLIAVPLSVALRDGPPVETQEPPATEAIRPGDRWHIHRRHGEQGALPVISRRAGRRVSGRVSRPAGDSCAEV